MTAKVAVALLAMGVLAIPAAHGAGNASANSTTRDATSATERAKEFVEDSAITAKVKSEFARDRQVSALRIKVDTDKNGVVTLSGTARSQAEADKAVSIARNTKGVTSVDNEIKVGVETTGSVTNGVANGVTNSTTNSKPYGRAY